MQRVPVSLVLSDHMLRGTTGIALAHQLKAIKPHVPFVLYSGAVPDIMGDADCSLARIRLSQDFFPSSAVSSEGMPHRCKPSSGQRKNLSSFLTFRSISDSLVLRF